MRLIFRTKKILLLITVCIFVSGVAFFLLRRGQPHGYVSNPASTEVPLTISVYYANFVESSGNSITVKLKRSGLQTKFTTDEKTTIVDIDSSGHEMPKTMRDIHHDTPVALYFSNLSAGVLDKISW